MKPIITFGGGCVINLDDIEDFPDYCQIITKLMSSIKDNKIQWSAMKTMLDADIEDVQHIPQFQQLMKQLNGNYQKIFDIKHKDLKIKYLILLMKMAKNYFTSFSIQQDEAGPIIKILQNQMPSYYAQFCDFWLSISKFAPYVEKHDALIKLYFGVINQKRILQNQELSLMYVKSIDKLLRFRMFRHHFIEVKQQIRSANLQIKNQTPFLDYKLSAHFNKHKQNSLDIIHKDLKFFKNYIMNNQLSSKWIKQYIAKKQSQDK